MDSLAYIYAALAYEEALINELNFVQLDEANIQNIQGGQGIKNVVLEKILLKKSALSPVNKRERRKRNIIL